ncbi:MAG TPA: phosphatidate cytidylyltransferase [Burkholderiales bacterium]|nr:phosphatidate cytidylyltransferase [Burkholderiales bacterium]
MLATRILTATALLAAFLAALFYLDQKQFAALVALVVAIAANEWSALAGAGKITRLAYAGASVLAYGLFLLLPELARGLMWGAFAFWAVVVPWRLARGLAPTPVLWTLAAGLIVIVPAGVAMATLARDLLLLLLGLIWTADTAAYFVGRAFGRHQLAPSISPGKTWEGVAGAVAGCIIYAIIWASFDPELRARVQGVIWVPFLAGVLLLCALSVLGDLFESALKRQSGAKDSGKLLPGHGGVLDRIDSATAALPGALLLMQAMGAA